MRHFQEKIKNCLVKELHPLSADAIASRLRIKRGERAAFLLDLKRLERTGAVSKNDRGQYSAAASGKLVRGQLVSLSSGFGFARMEEGDDCFIPGAQLNGALPGDTVLIRLGRREARGPHGRIMQIEQIGARLYTGRLLREEGRNGRPQYAVQPDGAIRFPVPVKKTTVGEAQPGDKIRFSVFYNERGQLTASVVTVYGQADSARICADSILDAAGIPTVFSEEADRQAREREAAGITAAEYEGRLDLRNRPVFTIDGRDAKDLDDAISLWEEDGRRVLGVHIADVSHYVAPHTPLDEEAMERGTSVYFADRVVPMLPTALSNGACSLNAGEDKLTMTALLTYDDAGVCRGFRMAKSVIRSSVRGVYSEVNSLFDGTATDTLREKYRPVAEVLPKMRTLAAQLREAAFTRGTLDLESREAGFVLDAEGHPVEIRPRVTGEAEEMIEQFMIAANEQVAKYAREKELPFVYRVHESPNEERLALLMEEAGRLGFRSVTDVPSKQTLQHLLAEAADTRYAMLISDQLLRSMAKAKYSAQPLGHYGLSLADYCHFTSPIRRYADLAIHRILTASLAGEETASFGRFAVQAAESASRCEVRAMTAERDCEACYKAEFMLGRLGQCFDGVVSSVSNFGVYVLLSDTVEGMIRLEELPDPAPHFDGMASVMGAEGGVLLTVGDPMRIRVASADVSTGKIGFVPAD